MRTALIGIAALVFSVASQAAVNPAITSIGNNANPTIATTTVAPGELVNIIGTNMGDTGSNCGSATGFTTTCGPVTVSVAGKAAGVRNESATLIIIQVPVDAPLGSGQIVVTQTVNGTPLASQPFSITVAAVAPLMYITNVNGVLIPKCFDASNNTISPTNPAQPGSTVSCLGNGFGATNPVVPTGVVTTPPLPNVVANVQVSIANVNVNVLGASLQGPTVGQDLVFFVVPIGISGGNKPITVTVNGVPTPTVQFPLSTLPTITSVSNVASQITPGLPNAGIAQGSIFLMLGSNLGPDNIAIDPHPFQDTSYSGTSVSVKVGSTTVNALLYYTATGYIAALLPSNTPAGAGTATVTFNNQPSNAFAITVVANNLGIFTYTQDGQGLAIVTYPDYTLVSAAKDASCGPAITACGAANPGDVLILWATGLGPISGDDARGDGLAVDMTSIPVQVWLGGVSAPVSYRGRSGCCIGEDQIVFTVPNNAPTGCAVPLIIQIGNEVSNSTRMPIANGSRKCPVVDPAFAGVDLEQGVLAGPVSFGDIKLHHSSNAPQPGYVDLMRHDFAKVLTYNPGSQPFFASYADQLPTGTCEVANNLNPDNYLPTASQAFLDAGAGITLTGPSGSKQISLSGPNPSTLSGNGNYLVPGPYSVTGNGGVDVGKINASITFPALPNLTSPNPNSAASVTRANGMTFNWTGGGTGNIQILLASATDNTFTTGALAFCVAAVSPGSFTIPPPILLALPQGNNGLYLFGTESRAPFTATGLNAGIIETENDGTSGEMNLQ